MKKLAALPCVFALLIFLFSGCGHARNDISKMNVILAIGIDSNAEDYSVSARVFEASSSTSDGDAETTVYTSSGATLSAAVDALTVAIGNEPLLSQSSVIIFGRETAEKGVDDLLEFILADDYIGPATAVVVAENSAEEIISAKSLDNFLPTDRFSNMMLAAWQNGAGVNARFMETVVASGNKFSDFCLPIIRIDPTGHIVTDSTGIFTDGSLVGELTPKEALGLLLLKDSAVGGQISVKDKNEAETVFEIKNAKTQLETDFVSNTVKIKADIRVSVRTEYSEKAYNGSQSAAELEMMAAKDLEKIVTDSYDKLARQMQSDPINIGGSLFAAGKIKAEDEEEFKSMLAASLFEVNVQVQISEAAFLWR